MTQAGQVLTTRHGLHDYKRGWSSGRKLFVDGGFEQEGCVVLAPIAPTGALSMKRY